MVMAILTNSPAPWDISSIFCPSSKALGFLVGQMGVQVLTYSVDHSL